MILCFAGRGRAFVSPRDVYDAVSLYLLYLRGAEPQFRQDLGRVEEAYQEVARRLGILPEGDARDFKGPAIMQ